MIVPLTLPIAVALLATAPSPPDCVGTIGSMTMTATHEGTITRGLSCYDAAKGHWWQEMQWEVDRDTTVWILFAATNEAHLLVLEPGVVRAIDFTTVRLDDAGNPTPSGIEVKLRRGQYRLQVQSKHLGVRYTVRPHRGELEDVSNIGACAKSTAANFTTNAEATAPVAVVNHGVQAACFDPKERPAIIRRFKLEQATDVAIRSRPQDGRATAAIYIAGPGSRTDDFWMAESPEPGEPARLTLPLPAGTYYLVLSADATSTRLDLTVGRTPSLVAARLPAARSPACADPTRAAPIALGAQVTGRITVEGSCGGPVREERPTMMELYRLTVPRRDTIAIAVDAPAFSPMLLLFRGGGEGLGGAVAEKGARQVRVDVPLEPGEYVIGVGHASPTEIGSYRLSVAGR